MIIPFNKRYSEEHLLEQKQRYCSRKCIEENKILLEILCDKLEEILEVIRKNISHERGGHVD